MILFWCLIGVAYLILGVIVTAAWAHLNGAPVPKDYDTKFLVGFLVLFWPFLLFGYVFMVPFLVLGTVVAYLYKEDPK